MNISRMIKMEIPIDVVSLDHLYAISRMVCENTNWKEMLDDATHLVRTILIFDNLAVYLQDPDTKEIEVLYAKAIGRGREGGEDVTWGEALASQVIQNLETILQQPGLVKVENRLKQPYLLGIPLRIDHKCLGALLLIRFGGPPYEETQVKLAEFIAQQVTQLIEKQQLYEIARRIDDQDKQIQLQKDFISTISHELRSPLGFIKGYTTTLLRSDTSWDNATQMEFLQIIDQETDHLQLLIENLLDSSRLQSGLLKMKYQHVRVDTLVRDAIARKKMYHSNLETELQIKGELSPIQGDPYRLSQVIENVLSNAVKYAPESKIYIKIEQYNGSTQIDISDNGPGIPQKYIPHIFERFFRNPEQSPTIHGSGLGLFICQQIMIAHQGSITAESKINQGTTIHIELPNQPKLI
jgi:K+-sensing histidine kinase KdpD